MGGCQNYGPFVGTLNNRCRIKKRTPKGTLILTTTQIRFKVSSVSFEDQGGWEAGHEWGMWTQVRGRANQQGCKRFRDSGSSINT